MVVVAAIVAAGEGLMVGIKLRAKPIVAEGIAMVFTAVLRPDRATCSALVLSFLFAALSVAPCCTVPLFFSSITSLLYILLSPLELCVV